MSNPTTRPERTDGSGPNTDTGTARSCGDRTMQEGNINDDLKIQQAITQPETSPEDDFPDGGLRAWIIVFGVSSVSSLTSNV